MLSLATLPALALILASTSLATTVCNDANGQGGVELRADADELCRGGGGARDVDAFQWDGPTGPKCAVVERIPASKTISTASMGCDHVFELNFLAQFLNNKLCPLLPAGTTVAEKQALIDPLFAIINSPNNARFISKALEDNFKTKDVVKFLASGTLDASKRLPQLKQDQAGFVAIGQYLTTNKVASVTVARNLDAGLKKAIAGIKTTAKLPTPNMESSWNTFLGLMSTRASTALKAGNFPKGCDVPACGTVGGKRAVGAACPLPSKSSSVVKASSTKAVKPVSTKAATVATKPAIKPAATPATKPVAVKPAAKPVAVKPAAKPVAVKPAAKPVAVKPAAKPVAVKPAVKPVAAKPAVKKPVVAAKKPVALKKTTKSKLLKRRMMAGEQ